MLSETSNEKKTRIRKAKLSTAKRHITILIENQEQELELVVAFIAVEIISNVIVKIWKE